MKHRRIKQKNFARLIVFVFFLVCWQRKALSLKYKFAINIEKIGVG